MTTKKTRQNLLTILNTDPFLNLELRQNTKESGLEALKLGKVEGRRLGLTAQCTKEVS